MIKKIIYYEDLEEVPYEQMDKIVNWHNARKLKEARHLDTYKEVYNQCPEYVHLPKNMQNKYLKVRLTPNFYFGGRGGTLKELEEQLEQFGYTLRHRKGNEITDCLYSWFIHSRTPKEQPPDDLEKWYIPDSDYQIFLDLEPSIGVTDNEPVPEDERQKRTLFYEDIEVVPLEILLKTGEEFKRVAEKQSQVMWEARKKKKGRLGHFYSVHKFDEYTPYLKCRAKKAVATSLDELKQQLEVRGYEFKHKQPGEWTEQRASRLYKVEEASGSETYIFMNIDYEIHYAKSDEMK